MLKELPEHRLTFLVRIRPRDESNTHTKDYTAFLRRLRFDSVLGVPYYDPFIGEDPTYLPEGNLLETKFSYASDDPSLFFQDYTDTRPFPRKEGDVYDPDEGLTLCHKYNMKTIRKAINKWRELESLKPHSSRQLQLLQYYQRAIGDYREWAQRRGLSFPQLSIQSQRYPGKLKEQYREEFLRLLNDPNATEELVREILMDKERWRNPSKYLHDVRRDKGLSTDELRKQSGFGWIDPKGTSKEE